MTTQWIDQEPGKEEYGLIDVRRMNEKRNEGWNLSIYPKKGKSKSSWHKTRKEAETAARRWL